MCNRWLKSSKSCCTSCHRKSDGFLVYDCMRHCCHPFVQAFVLNLSTATKQRPYLNLTRPSGSGSSIWCLGTEDASRWRPLWEFFLANAIPANEEHCVVVCGGSWNAIGGRTRPLFENAGTGSDTETLFTGSLRQRCWDSRAQCVPEASSVPGPV